MRTRADYDRAWALVREVIHAWDPYDLIGQGAPDDEWDAQIASIVAQVPHMRSPDDATQAIHRVFRLWLSPEAPTLLECSPPGRRLFQALVDADLVADPDRP
jgi:hypothetical protein